jgi:hypothetical protein
LLTGQRNTIEFTHGGNRRTAFVGGKGWRDVEGERKGSYYKFHGQSPDDKRLIIVSQNLLAFLQIKYLEQ